MHRKENIKVQQHFYFSILQVKLSSAPREKRSKISNLPISREALQKQTEGSDLVRTYKLTAQTSSFPKQVEYSSVSQVSKRVGIKNKHPELNRSQRRL